MFRLLHEHHFRVHELTLQVCSGGAGYMRGGSGGGFQGQHGGQGYGQGQMGFSPHVYPGMMHPGAAPMQYYYNNVGMVRISSVSLLI